MLEGSFYKLYLSPVLAPPFSTNFQSLTALHKVTGGKKNLVPYVCVCERVCRQVCFYLEKHYSVQDKKMSKTESVLKCLCCKRVYSGAREGTFSIDLGFF